MRLPPCSATFLTTVLAAASAASAAPIATESFNYTGTTINAQGAAADGWGGAWTVTQVGGANNHSFNASTSLTYPAGVKLTPAGGRIANMSDEVASRPLAASINGNAARTMWVSMLVQKTDSGAVGFGFEAADATRRLSFGFLSDEKLGVNVGGGTPNAAKSTASYANDAPVLLVAKITLTDTTDSVSLKAFNASDAILEPANFDVTHATPTNLVFTKFFVGGLTSTT